MHLIIAPEHLVAVHREPLSLLSFGKGCNQALTYFSTSDNYWVRDWGTSCLIYCLIAA